MKLTTLGSSSKGNCYIFESGEETLVLEAGVNFKKIQQALNFDFSKVVGTLVSHCHGDHSKAVKDMTIKGHKVYSHRSTFEQLKIDSVYAVHIEPKKTFHLGGFKIMPFDVKHDAPDTLGFIIEHKDMGRLVFITDTYYVKYKFPKANHYLIECNYCTDIIKKKYKDMKFLRDRIFQSHFSLQNCLETLKANDLTFVKSINLIHLSDSNSDENKFINEVIGATGKITRVLSAGKVVEL